MVEFRLGQFECSAGDGERAPFGGRSAGQHHTWFRIRGHLRGTGPDWSGLVGSRIARLWRCWDSPRSDWLAEHAPPCGLVAIASELARIDSKRSTDLYERAMRQADAEGTDLSPYIRASTPLECKRSWAEDIDRAIMMFASCVRSSDWQGTRYQRCLQFLRNGMASLSCCMRVRWCGPESDLVPPALLLSLEPMVNTTEDELALARCWVGLGEEARARPYVDRRFGVHPTGGGAHGCVGDERQAARSTPEERTAKASFGPVKTGSVQVAVSQTQKLAVPADPVLAEY